MPILDFGVHLMEETKSDEVLRNLRKIIRAVDLSSKKLARDFGLTGPQALILSEVRKSGGIPVSTLATRVSLSHATVTDILNRLAKRGLVTRTRDQVDKRRQLVSITEDGLALVASAPASLQKRFVERYDRLPSWEQSMILAGLERVALLMNAEDLDAAPLLTSGAMNRLETEV